MLQSDLLRLVMLDMIKRNGEAVIMRLNGNINSDTIDTLCKTHTHVEFPHITRLRGTIRKVGQGGELAVTDLRITAFVGYGGQGGGGEEHVVNFLYRQGTVMCDKDWMFPDWEGMRNGMNVIISTLLHWAPNVLKDGLNEWDF